MFLEPVFSLPLSAVAQRTEPHRIPQRPTFCLNVALNIRLQRDAAVGVAQQLLNGFHVLSVRIQEGGDRITDISREGGRFKLPMRGNSISCDGDACRLAGRGAIATRRRGASSDHVPGRPGFR